MKKNTLYTLCLAVAVFITIPLSVYANNKIFFISPTRVEITPKDKVQVVNITNLSDKTRAYEIRVTDIVMTEDGVTKGVDNFEYSAKRMVRYVPRDFVLKPNERQAIRIMSRIKPDTPDGDYHSHVMFYENIKKSLEHNAPETPSQTDNLVLNAEADYQTLIPIVISHGKVDTQIGMNSVQIDKTANPNQYKLSMMLTRSGNGQGKALISTDHVAADGTVTNVSLRRTFHIYREINERKASYTVTLPEGLTGGSLRLNLYNSPAAEAQPLDTVTIGL